jgi:hypothetical protein
MAQDTTKNNFIKEGMIGAGQHKMFTVLLILMLLIAGGIIGFLVNESDLMNNEEDDNGAATDVFYQPTIDPSNFIGMIDNTYMPMVPGSTYIYDATSDSEVQHIEVIVTNETKIILGVQCVVVRDTVKVAGLVVEDTFDWYAQDLSGNVWYFGEDSKTYENGNFVSSSGSWEAGVDGALPGIVMLADPLAGVTYRQEYYQGEAEDMAEVLVLNTTATVPTGSYDHVLKTREWSALDPGAVEDKYYAQGIGCVLEVTVSGGSERVELVGYVPGP